jgi:uncharacterized protein (DUF2249 family)
MELEQKQQVTEAVSQWIDEKNPARSASKLAEKSGVNAAYISRIKNGEYEMQSGGGRITVISDHHFHRLAEAVGFKFDDEYKWDFINSYKLAYNVMRKAQRKQLRGIIDGDTGQGKTFTSKWYNRENDYVLFIECSRNMTGKALINTMCDKLGIELPTRTTPFEKLELIKKVLTSRRGYVIMFDQVGKAEVKPSIYGVIMDIAVAIEGKAGMVISGYKVTEMLTHNYNRHVPGMRQLARRFMSNTYELPQLTTNEIALVCEQEGITNKGAVTVLQKHVRDLDMLSQYVRDVQDFQKKYAKKITAEEVIDLFNIKYTSLKAA